MLEGYVAYGTARNVINVTISSAEVICNRYGAGLFAYVSGTRTFTIDNTEIDVSIS